MTDGGYWSMRKNDTMSLKVFEKICEFFEVDPMIFLKENTGGNFFQDSIVQYGHNNTGTYTKASKEELHRIIENLKQKNKEIQQKVDDKNKIIKLLETQIKLLEEHLRRQSPTKKRPNKNQ